MSSKKPGFFVKQVIAWLLKGRESYGIHDCRIFAAIHLSWLRENLFCVF